MKFRKIVKNIDTSKYYFEMIEPKKLKAQYNPERFHLWKSLHRGPEKKVLNMVYSPHYRFLKNRKDKSYYKLQKLFKRNNKWISAKIKKFLDVYESIKNEGIKEDVVVLEKPIFKNKYNNSYEIFEGHHRVACALVLGIEKIPCKIIRRKVK